MTQKPKSPFSGAGYAVAALLCLMAVGLGAYGLLFRMPAAQTQTPPAPAVTAPQTPVTAPLQKEPTVEVVVPTPMEEDTPDPEPMPEEPVDNTPVMAVPPQLIVSPLNGQVVAAFSVDALTYNATLDDWRTHDGIDISAANGTNVLAAAAGTVLSAGDDDRLGTTVVLEHSGGIQTTYANLQSKPTVKVGDSVSAGQVLGAVGETSMVEAAEGPHLHFSVSKDGDAVNPSEFLKD